MDRNSIIALLLLCRRRKRRRNGLHWVHPIIQKREVFGAFYALFCELRDKANKSFNYFRMNVSSFDETEKTVILRFLNDLRCGHQFRQICWNYPVRDLFKEHKVQMYYTSL